MKPETFFCRSCARPRDIKLLADAKTQSGNPVCVSCSERFKSKPKRKRDKKYYESNGHRHETNVINRLTAHD